MLRLIVGLCQEEFRIPFPMSLLAAYYTTRASLAWVPVNHDERKVLRYLEKFYRVARRYAHLESNSKQVAVLELRSLLSTCTGVLSGKPGEDEFLQTLVDLHSAIFGLAPEQARESAEWRLLAANTVDLITSRRIC